MSELHQVQRSMRALRRAALQRGSIALLDVGTSKITCLVLRFDGPASFRTDSGVGPMAGQSSFRIVGAATTQSRGVRFGEIQTMAETERAIRTAVQGAQKHAGERIDHVIATMSGGRPASYGIAGEIDLPAGKVREGDIARVMAAADVPDFGRGREVLHAQPVNFAVDQRSGLSDPRGHAGNRLAMDMHVLTADEAALGTLVHAIRRCDLEVAGVASGAYVSGLSSLVEDEQELGAACIDMGGGTTTMSVFVDGKFVHADALPIGGRHVTMDLARGLSTRLEDAERLKVMHGSALPATSADERDVVTIQPMGEEGEQPLQVPRAVMTRIVRARIEEILELVRDRLNRSGYGSLVGRRVVLTGGASQLAGLPEAARRLLGRNVRLGRPLGVAGLPEAAKGPAFAAPVGLLIYPQVAAFESRAAKGGIFTRVTGTGGRFQRVGQWLRDSF